MGVAMLATMVLRRCRGCQVAVARGTVRERVAATGRTTASDDHSDHREELKSEVHVQSIGGSRDEIESELP